MKRGRPPTRVPDMGRRLQAVGRATCMLPTGQRRPVPMPGIAEHEGSARPGDGEDDAANRAREGGFAPEEALETVNEWFETWVERRAKQRASRPRTTTARATANGSPRS